MVRAVFAVVWTKCREVWKSLLKGVFSMRNALRRRPIAKSKSGKRMYICQLLGGDNVRRTVHVVKFWNLVRFFVWYLF